MAHDPPPSSPRAYALQASVAERPVVLPQDKGVPVSTVNEYHMYARDCLRWAAKARTEEQRRQFVSLASDWTHAAAGLEGVLGPEVLQTQEKGPGRIVTLTPTPPSPSDEAE
jgi:hypothetical protein